MVYGFSPIGVVGRLVRVEVDIRRGLPGTDIVGLPSSEVKEARERVRVAIKNSGFSYPADRILINLSPAEIPKVGSGFDLPIAIAILIRSSQIRMNEPLLATGELSVGGAVIPVRGTLSAVLTAQEFAVRPAVVSARVQKHLTGISVGPKDVVMLTELRQLAHNDLTSFIPSRNSRRSIRGVNFDDMQGQGTMKWASAIAAAGSHNILYMGPPGSGKTMAARRLVSLLPDLSPHDAREVARIYSMRGIEGISPGARPPLRMPHHSASLEGILGGGRMNLPGEVSLAHRGVLVLDEATEFRPHVIQALREPVEAGKITLSRAGRAEEYPSRFLVALTSNLCPCGKLGQDGELCMCSVHEVARYWKRLGAALLDRIDIRVRSGYSRRDSGTITNDTLRQQVEKAIERQQSRGGGGYRNGRATPATAGRLLHLPDGLVGYFNEEMQKLGLSDRAAMAVRGLARTIADMDGRKSMEVQDIEEAVGMRLPGPERLA